MRGDGGRSDVAVGADGAWVAASPPTGVVPRQSPDGDHTAALAPDRCKLAQAEWVRSATRPCPVRAAAQRGSERLSVSPTTDETRPPRPRRCAR